MIHCNSSQCHTYRRHHHNPSQCRTYRRHRYNPSQCHTYRRRHHNPSQCRTYQQQEMRNLLLKVLRFANQRNCQTSKNQNS